MLGRHPWRILLALLITSIVMRGALGDSLMVEILQIVLFWVIFFGTVETVGVGTRFLYVSRIMLLVWVILQLFSSFSDASLVALNTVVTIFNLVVAAGAIIYSFRELLKTRSADLDSILAAVFGYLLISVGFALVYAAVEVSIPGAFELSGSTANFSTFMYYSLVTMTTLGYGVILPLNDTVRILAGLQAVFGTLYFAVFIGALVGRL